MAQELLFQENELEPQKPRFIAPEVRSYRPTIGEFITRPIGGSSTIESSYDPWATRSGLDSKKYGFAALHPAAQPAVKFLAEGPFWVEWDFHGVNDYKIYPDYEYIDEKVLKLLDYVVDNLQYETFENTLKGIWKDAFVYGFSVSEINYGFDGSYMICETIKTHSPFNFEFYTDQGNNLDRIYYTLTGTYIERETLPKFLVVTYPYIHHGKFYGTSLLQSVYFDIKLIEVLEESYAEGTRRLAIRPIIHHFAGNDMSDTDITRVRNSLYNLDSGALVSFPATPKEDGTITPQHDIKVLEDRASPDGTALIKDLLDILYKRVNRSLGLPDDLGFASTNIGSLAKAREEMNLYTQTIVNNQGFIEGFVNRKIIPSIIKYNFPSLLNERSYKLPVFRFGTVEEEYDTAKIQNMLELIEAGVLDREHDMDYIREELRLPAMPKEALDDQEAIKAEETQATGIEPKPEEAPQTTEMDAYWDNDDGYESPQEYTEKDLRIMKRIGRNLKHKFFGK